MDGRLVVEWKEAAAWTDGECAIVAGRGQLRPQRKVQETYCDQH